MKKLFMFLTISFISLFTFGCSSKENQSSIANPWIEVNSIDEAIEEAGFNDFEVPESIKDKEISYIAVLENDEPIIEVIYGDDITVRKGLGDSDISGDYNEYSIKEIHDGENISFNTKGNNELINNVTWINDNYSYSIFTNNGLNIETVNNLVNIIK